MNTPLKIALFLVIPISLFVASPAAYKSITDYLWEPPTVFDGIPLGMSRSDVIFRKGKDSCSAVSCKIGEVSAILDIDKKVHRFKLKSDVIDMPFTSVEAMQAMLGEEDILSIHKDFSKRKYTYLDIETSFLFDTNILSSVTIGEVTWGELTPLAEYFVQGKAICPSADCPWEEDGETLKVESKDASYADFYESEDEDEDEDEEDED